MSKWTLVLLSMLLISGLSAVLGLYYSSIERKFDLAARETLVFFAREINNEMNQSVTFDGCYMETKEDVSNDYRIDDVILGMEIAGEKKHFKLAFLLRDFQKNGPRELEDLLDRLGSSIYDLPLNDCMPWLRAMEALSSGR